VPFAFTGKINQLTIRLDPPKLSPEEKAKLEQALQQSLRKAD